jgi:hypothetical protein
MFRLLPLLFLLMLLAVLVAVVAMSIAAGRASRAKGLPVGPQAQLIEAINERAWADRDVSPVLSQALIERIRAAHQSGVRRPDLLVDELRELAWTHRDSDPELSVVVLDLIKNNQLP